MISQYNIVSFVLVLFFNRCVCSVYSGRQLSLEILARRQTITKEKNSKD